MGILVPLALFGFPLLVLLLFAVLPHRRAMLSAYIGGWLFLPHVSYYVQGLPTYDKYTAIAIGTVLGVALFNQKAIRQYRLRPIDVPMLLFCLWPAASHLHHGNPVSTAVNWVLVQLFQWGIPYLLGRLYFTNRSALRELAIAVFVGGLAYMPLCWIEIRMSPNLSPLIYGFFTGSFGQAIRFGGYRPIVFMQHGLMVALWMATASVVGLWLWRSGSLLRLGTVPMGLLVPLMYLTTIACKSGNGWIELAVGTTGLVAVQTTRSSVLLMILGLVAPGYLLARATGALSGDVLVNAVAQFSEDRAGSLRARMYQEDVYVANAMGQPVFGWAGKGFIPVDEHGDPLTRGNDSFWIITLGLNGIVSLASVFALLSLCPMSAIWRHRLGGVNPETGPVMALALVLSLFAIDCLANGMLIPAFPLMAGALASAGGMPRPAVDQQPDACAGLHFKQPLS